MTVNETEDVVDLPCSSVARNVAVYVTSTEAVLEIVPERMPVLASNDRSGGMLPLSSVKVRSSISGSENRAVTSMDVITSPSSYTKSPPGMETGAGLVTAIKNDVVAEVPSALVAVTATV